MATTSITVQPMITMGLGVPRAAYVRFPIGNPFGEAGNIPVQRAILHDVLQLVWEASESHTVVKLPYRWRRGLPKSR